MSISTVQSAVCGFPRAREGMNGRFLRGEDKAAKKGEADLLLIRRCSLTPAAAARPKRPAIHSWALTPLMIAGVLLLTRGHSPAAELVVPAQPATMFLAVELPDGLDWTPEQAVVLAEVEVPDAAIAAQVVPAMAEDGMTSQRGRLIAVVPPRAGATAERRFRVNLVPEAAGPFQWDGQGDTTLKLSQDGKPVLAYNYGTMTGENVPETDHRRRAACYIHPLWGLHGEVLTDDFPRDHYHHHGIFWTWPHIGIEGREYNSWAGDNIQLRKVDWLHKAVGPAAAVLAVENGWFIEPEFGRKVMVERVWMFTYQASDGSRAIDLEFTWIPTETPVTLWGAGGKSYGGLTVRFIGKPHEDQVITVPSGRTTEDLPMTPLAWADFSRHFEGAPGRSGAAVMVHPGHPDYPPTWLTRHYGPLCVGWPGVEPQTFEPGKPIRLAYRIWIHADDGNTEAIQQAYDAYAAGNKARWE